MEVYGRNSGRERLEQYPQQERKEAEIEESMWRLGQTNDGETYPERPGVSDCMYYMGTGFCRFGTRCRYNHPRDRPAATMAMKSAEGGEYPERAGERVCQYYLRTGFCKFGATCKFDHPRNSRGSLSNVSLNCHGYPLRPGEKECFYYMRMGQCKFGIGCKFHHPEPADVRPVSAGVHLGTAGVHPESAAISIPTTVSPFYPAMQTPSIPMPEPIGTASTSFRIPMPPPLHGSYVSGTYGSMLLPTGVVPIPSWTSYSAPLSPALSPSAQPSVGAGSLFGLTTLSSIPTAAGPYSPMWPHTGWASADFKELKFPERPGHPECQYYLRTGDCKFGSSCRFHHPTKRTAFVTAGCLSPLGLPVRPGEKPCAFYIRNGFCRFGTTCKFDHPVLMSSSVKQSNDPAASSLPPLPTSLSPDMSPQAARLVLSSESSSTSLIALTLSETTPVSPSDVEH